MRLSIYCHDLTTSYVVDRPDPLFETLLELSRIQLRKDPTESVVRRDSIRQFKQSAEQILLGLAEHLQIHPRVGTSDDCGEGNDDDIHQLVPFCVTGSGICQFGELIAQQAYGYIVHVVTPSLENSHILLHAFLGLSECDCPDHCLHLHTYFFLR